MKRGRVVDKDPPDTLVERLASLSIGLLSGMALGFAVGLLAMFVRGDAPLAAFVLGGGALGAVLGLAGLAFGFGLAEAVMHVVGGFLAIDALVARVWRGASDDQAHDDASPAWKGVLAVCAAIGFVLYVAMRWRY